MTRSSCPACPCTIQLFLAMHICDRKTSRRVFRRISPCTCHMFPGASLLIKSLKFPSSLTGHPQGLLNSCFPPFYTAKSCAIRSMKKNWEYFLLEKCSRNASHYKHCFMNRCQEVLILLQLQHAITRRYPGQNRKLCSAAAHRGVVLPIPGSYPHLLTSSSNCCLCLLFNKGLTFAIGCWTVPLRLVLWDVKSYKPFYSIMPGCLGEMGHSFHDPLVISQEILLF